MLKFEFLEPLGLTQVEFARKCKLSQKVINEICQNRRAVTARTSILIGKALDIGPEFMLLLQVKLDLWNELNKKKRTSMKKAG
jgi:addiction module HigA family antidote